VKTYPESCSSLHALMTCSETVMYLDAEQQVAHKGRADFVLWLLKREEEGDWNLWKEWRLRK